MLIKQLWYHGGEVQYIFISYRFLVCAKFAVFTRDFKVRLLRDFVLESLQNLIFLQKEFADSIDFIRECENNNN